MSLLVDDQRFINLKFHYIERVGKYISKFKFIHSPEEYEEHKSNPNLKEINTGWKVLTWAEHNEINSQCIQYETNETGINIQKFDFVKFRDMKLKMCLKNWDLKDERGQLIQVSPKIIDKLIPEVATELLNGFEKVTEIEEGELKN